MGIRITCRTCQSADCWAPPLEFLIEEIWPPAQESAFLKSSEAGADFQGLPAGNHVPEVTDLDITSNTDLDMSLSNNLIFLSEWVRERCVFVV